MLNVIRKIVIWIIGLPILLISICFITVATMLTTVGTFVFKSTVITDFLPFATAGAAAQCGFGFFTSYQ